MTDTTDIVALLREEVMYDAFGNVIGPSILTEAVARVTALEAEVVRLREALEPFATWASYYRATTHDHYVPECEIDGPGHSLTITLGDFRRARAALEGQS